MHISLRNRVATKDGESSEDCLVPYETNGFLSSPCTALDSIVRREGLVSVISVMCDMFRENFSR